MPSLQTTFATLSPQTFHVVNVVAWEKPKNQTKKQLLAKPTKNWRVQNKFVRLVKHAFFCHALPFITYGMRMKKKNKKAHCISTSKQKNRHGRNNRIVTTLFRAIKMIFFCFLIFFLFLKSIYLNKERSIFLDVGTEAVAGCERDF